MRILRYSVAILTLGAVLFAVYQLPAVKVLFKPVEKNEDPLAFLRDLPEPEPREVPQRVSPREKEKIQRTDTVSERVVVDSTGTAVPRNQVANSEVGRVLIQILKARRLADGISISVTDQEVLLYGKVDSQDELSEIIDILNKARETRTVNVESAVIGGD